MNSEPFLSRSDEVLATQAGTSVADNQNTQTGDLYRLLPKDEKERLHHNVTEAMDGVPIQIRGVARFCQADKDCGLGLAEVLGLDEAKIEAEVKKQQAE